MSVKKIQDNLIRETSSDIHRVWNSVDSMKEFVYERYFRPEVLRSQCAVLTENRARQRRSRLNNGLNTNSKHMRANSCFLYNLCYLPTPFADPRSSNKASCYYRHKASK